MTLDHPFDRLSGRAILLASVLGMAPGLFLLWLLRDDFGRARSVAGIALYGGVALVLVLVARWRGVELRRLLGRALGTREVIASAALGLAVLVFSFGSMIALLGGLSLVFPQILERYADNSMDFLIRKDGRLDVVSTVLLAVTAGIVGPVVEELVFRGFLLTRWARRFGVRSGVVFSALLFGLLHFALAPLGAFALGLVAAVLYLRTRSLVAPILAHATANSTIVFATLLGRGAERTAMTPPGVDELRGL
ncbi:MAG: CPBP family intramembrane glutamic endopeptidase, partial [Candidatus Eisenbacteria bacterium]